MIHLLQKYAANGFADFRGLNITGTVPVKQELINEVLAESLKLAASAVPAKSSEAPAIDPKVFLGLVKKAQVRAEAGVLILDFEVRA